MKTSAETIQLGIEQGIFPFGEYIQQGNGRKTWYIYKAKLEAWMQERDSK